jgi:hypothetical protein
MQVIRHQEETCRKREQFGPEGIIWQGHTDYASLRVYGNAQERDFLDAAQGHCSLPRASHLLNGMLDALFKLGVAQGQAVVQE